MTDFFALLDEPRRPWLEADVLKKKFLALSAKFHPDKIHSAGDAEKSGAAKKFAELNAAFNCLLEPKSRLLQLLQLELGVKPQDVQQIPSALANLFAEVATTCRNADAFLIEKNQATSPLVQVQFFERAQEWIDRLRQLQVKLGDLNGKLTGELKTLDAAWTRADAASKEQLLPGLEDLYRLFAFLNRWSGQIQERVLQLAL